MLIASLVGALVSYLIVAFAKDLWWLSFGRC